MTMAILREVRLYGELGARFGRVHRLAIATPHEAVRALTATLAGFGEFLCGRTELGYRVLVDRTGRTLEQLHEPFGRTEVVKIVPVVGGAKRGGLGFILAGIALFFGAPFIGGLMASTAAGGAVALYGAKIGVALMLGGVVQLLSPQPKGSPAGATNEQSYGYDGPENTTQQGVAVPLCYGRVIWGGPVISSGLLTDDISPPAPAPAPAPEPLPAWEYTSPTDASP